MESVQGIGGVFIRSKDREALCRWYAANLGLDIDESWWGTTIAWSEQHDAPRAQTVWSAFKDDTTYFGDGAKAFMINFRVRDLDAMLAQLRANGAEVDDRVEDSEYGKFGWVTDPEGNRVELWQPPA
jgi:predicted enzyme related to lactoylglutathione lyase